MKAIGVIQLNQKKFKLLEVPDEWKGILGQLPAYFVMCIIGYSGNGKTEFCVRFAKFLTRFGKVAWLSYEQGHGFDLQLASIRNNLEEVSGKFIPIDPTANRKEGSTFFDELVAFCMKRGSPMFIFIDSIDYTNFTWAQYKYLKETFKKKSFIFIGHATKTGNPKKDITEQIMFDGQKSIVVRKYIAISEKSRIGGFEPYIIWEEKARELNPQFFK